MGGGVNPASGTTGTSWSATPVGGVPPPASPPAQTTQTTIQTSPSTQQNAAIASTTLWGIHSTLQGGSPASPQGLDHQSFISAPGVWGPCPPVDQTPVPGGGTDWTLEPDTQHLVSFETNSSGVVVPGSVQAQGPGGTAMPTTTTSPTGFAIDGADGQPLYNFRVSPSGVEMSEPPPQYHQIGDVASFDSPGGSSVTLPNGVWVYSASGGLWQNQFPQQPGVDGVRFESVSDGAQIDYGTIMTSPGTTVTPISPNSFRLTSSNGSVSATITTGSTGPSYTVSP